MGDSLHRKSLPDTFECLNPLSHWATAAPQHHAMAAAFAPFISKNPLATLSTASTKKPLSGMQKQVTLLSCYIRNIDTLSEAGANHRLSRQLNALLTLATRHVIASGGRVEHCAHHGIRAFFEANRGMNTAKAVAAIETALRIQQAVAALRYHWQDKQLPALDVVITLHTGPVWITPMNTPAHMGFTLLGETVIEAARLCSAASDKGKPSAKIIVSDATRAQLRHLPMTFKHIATSPDDMRQYAATVSTSTKNPKNAV